MNCYIKKLILRAMKAQEFTWAAYKMLIQLTPGNSVETIPLQIQNYIKKKKIKLFPGPGITVVRKFARLKFVLCSWFTGMCHRSIHIIFKDVFLWDESELSISHGINCLWVYVQGTWMWVVQLPFHPLNIMATQWTAHDSSKNSFRPAVNNSLYSIFAQMLVVVWIFILYSNDMEKTRCARQHVYVCWLWL